MTKPFRRPDVERIKKILVAPSDTSLLEPRITCPGTLAVEGVALGEGVAVGEDVAVGEGVVLAEGDADGVAAGRRTPLFQRIFFPDLIAVYFFPRQIIVWPTFLGTKVGPAAANAVPLIKEASAPEKPASM